MRLFVAVDPPPEAVARVAAGVATVRSTADVPASVRWSDPARWHVTLAFLGEVPDERLPRLEAALTAELGRRVRQPVPQVAVAGAGRFGRSVLWAGLVGDVDGVARLAAAVRRAARAARVAVAPERYHPHLTLARVSDRRARVDLRPLVAALDTALSAGPTWQVQPVRLVQSVLGPRPEHQPVRAWSLADEPGGPPGDDGLATLDR